VRQNIATKDRKKRNAKSRRLSVKDIDWETCVARQRKRRPEQAVAKDLGLPKSLLHVLEEDDWSLVVKVHAYIEAAMNQLLTAHFNDSRLDEIIQRMDMGNKMRGKLGLIKALDLLPPEAWSFVKLLSELRNSIVHRLKCLDLNLKKHLQDENLKNQWEDALNWWCSDRSKKWDAIVFLFPRNAIVTAASMVMHTAVDRKGKVRIEQIRVAKLTVKGELADLRSTKRKLLIAIAKESLKRHRPTARNP
jgi:hypothetical protein